MEAVGEVWGFQIGVLKRVDFALDYQPPPIFPAISMTLAVSP